MSEQPPGHRVIGTLAQTLADVLTTHAPHGAKISSEQSRATVDEWLEGLEAHTVKFVGPLAEMILANTEPPPAIRAILEEAIDPQAQFSTTLVQIFLWGTISAVVSVSLGPFLQGISNDLNTAAVNAGIHRPIDLSTIATAAGRGLNLNDPPTVTVPQWAYDQAAMLGIDSAAVDLAASLVGLPPAMQELFEMMRRGIIQEPDVARGLREGDFRDDWIQYAVQLAHTWLTPGDFVRAAVQAQLPYDVARSWAEKTGLDVSTAVPLDPGGSQATPDMFGMAYALGGRPPGPEEAGRMANRGIIPWQGTGAGATTFEQAIAESDVKIKWTDALKQLQVYVPPPRTVGTLLEHGAITADQAVTFWEDGGVPTALAQGYLYQAQQEHIGQDKLLAKGDILTAYFDHIFTLEQAESALGDLGFRQEVAAEMLELVDFRREVKAINTVVSKVGTLYQAFKISAANALIALENIGIGSEQANSLLTTWDEIRFAPVRVPTAGEISKAFQYGTIDQPEALAALGALGYQDRDAAIVLSAGSEAKIAPLPPAGTTTTG